MKHLGDITKIHGASVEPVEVIIGGSPCQDLSVAGKRAGLDGERSGLFMEQIRIIKEMRENDRANGRTDDAIRPRYMVWENVPGAFSSNKGEDFRIVLEETAKIADPEIFIPRPPQGKWTNAGCIVGRGYSIAWRVLDAQYFGVPQRRRRIALVADFGGQSAPEILFERESMPGNIEPSGTERERTAEDAERSSDKAISFQERAGCAGGEKESSSSTIEQAHSAPSTINRCYGISAYESNAMKSSNPHSGVYEADTSRTLDNNGGNPACNQGGMAIVQSAGFKGGQSSGGIGYVDEQSPTLQATPSALEPTVAVFDASRRHNYEPFENVSETVQARYGTGGGNIPIVLEGNGSRESHKGNGYRQSDTMYTLNTIEQHAVCYDARENGSGDLAPTITGDHQDRVTDYTALCIGNGQMCNMAMKPIANSLDTMHDQQAVITAVDCRNGKENQNTNGTLQSKPSGGTSYNLQNVCRTGSLVRRLTPMECERLQGYPDHWTDIGEWTDSKGKKHKDADSPRYKALGNSIAVPCWRFILERISERVTEHTMASLFDGIGGFPLIWEQINGSKSCRWVSEIEEFPIAVTKIRFEQEE